MKKLLTQTQIVLMSLLCTAYAQGLGPQPTQQKIVDTASALCVAGLTTSDDATTRSFKSDCGSGCSCGCSSCSCAPHVVLIKKLPFVIDKPGVYCLACNLTAPNCEAAGNSIEITVSNVTLNLNGFTLAGGNVGILVDAFLRNVMIQNGSIINADAEGIVVLRGCENVQLIDLNVINCNHSKCNTGVAGIAFKGLFNQRITNSVIRNVAITACTNIGLSMLFCDGFKVLNTCALSIINTNGQDAVGFYVSGNFDTFDQCKTGHLINTLANNTAYGFFLDVCKDTTLTKCQANDITSINGTPTLAGFVVDTCMCARLQDCLASNIDGLPNAGAVGFISQFSNGTLLKDNVACGITSLQGIGFELLADNKSCLTECAALSCSTSGILVMDFGPGLQCLNCIITKNKVVGPGINLGSAPANNVFSANFATSYNPTIPHVHNLGATFPPAGAGDNILGV